MGAVKNLSLCVLSFALFAQVAQAAPVPWTLWSTYNPNFSPALSNNITTQNTLSAFSAYSAQATPTAVLNPVSATSVVPAAETLQATAAPMMQATAAPVMMTTASATTAAAPAEA